MSLGKLLLRGVLAVVVPVALAVLVVKWRVAVTLDQWIEQARPFAVVTRGGSFVNLEGDIGVEQVSVAPVDGSLGTVRAARITLHTPGLWWLVRNGVLGGREVPQRFGLSVDGLDTTLVETDDDTPTLVGVESGAPFDHAGCQDAPFTDAELLELGLPREPTRLSAGYTRSPDGAMRIEVGVARAGSASTALVMRLRTAPGEVRDATAIAAATFEGLDLTVQDEGFVAARNAACASRNQLDADAFQAAHLTDANRRARALGLAPDAAAWDTYARFAREGGPLTLVGAPRKPVPLIALQQNTGPDGSLLMSWQMRSGEGAARPVQFASITPEKLAGSLTLAQQVEAELAAERAQVDALRAGGAVPAEADAATTANAPAPGAPTLPVAADGAVAAASAAVPVAPVAPLAPVAAGDAAGKPGEWVLVDYAALAVHVGAPVRVVSVHGTRREGTLERWNPAGMVVRLRPVDGGIPLSMTPRDVREVRIQLASGPG
jgi:hypothetical protein